MAGLILIALVMRLYQPDWYNDRSFHPDERWIVWSAVPDLHYPGKPIGLQYGSLPLYILSIYKDVVNDLGQGIFRGMDRGKAITGGARAISGLVDTGTIVFIFMIGTYLFNRRVGLLGGALATFTVLNIHASHFFTVDTFTAFFIAASFYFCAKISREGNRWDYVLSAVFYAAALASKTAALPLGAALVAAHLIYVFSVKGRDKKAVKGRINAWTSAAIAVGAALLAFFIFMPHAILDMNKFIQNQNEQKRILVTGEGDVPYNRQYLDTTPYLFYIKNLVLYTMGVPYGLAAFTAFFFYIWTLVYRLIKERKLYSREILLLLAWMVPYFLIVGMSFGKFNRYMIPLTPFLGLLAAKLIYDLYDYFKGGKIASAIKWVVLGGAVFYSLAFMNIYTNSHTWIQASRWIYANVPFQQEVKKGQFRPTMIMNEEWGDDLPVAADGNHGGMYQNVKWAVQEPDSQRKIEELSTKLSMVDYVAMADKRAYGTYLRIPDRYPLNYFYFRTMLTNPEKLGYVKVYEKAVYPSFLGITINDDRADESFQLYDHPHVYFFKNEKYLAKEEIASILAEGQQEIALRYPTIQRMGRVPLRVKLLKIRDNTKQEWLVPILDKMISNMKAPGASYSRAQSGLKGMLAEVRDTTKSELLAKILSKIAGKGREFPNKNIGQKKDSPVALLPKISIALWLVLVELLALMSWPLNFLIFRDFRDKGYGLSKIQGIFLFAFFNWLVVSTGAVKFTQAGLWVALVALFAASTWAYRANLKEIRTFVKNNLMHIYITEAIFAGAYLLFILIKLWSPNIHDIAGHGYNGGGEPMGMAYLSAIYNGVKFPPLDPWLGGLSLNYYYWGQLVMATLSKTLGYAPNITYNLSLSLLFALSFIGAFTVAYNMTGKYKYGLLAGGLLALAGNFYTLEFVFSAITNAFNLNQFLDRLFSFQFIWDPTRLYPNHEITEVPFFSYLYGDLHAHNIVIPFTVLLVAIVYAVIKSGSKKPDVMAAFGTTTASRVATMLMAAALLGVMMPMNTWNYPPMLMMVVLALCVVEYNALKAEFVAGKPKGRAARLTHNILMFVGITAGVAAASYLLYLPFHLNFGAPGDSAKPRLIGKAERALLYRMFEYFSVFFFIIITYMSYVWFTGSEAMMKKAGLAKLKWLDFDRLGYNIEKVLDRAGSNSTLAFRLITGAACAFIALALSVFVQPTFGFLFLGMVLGIWLMLFSKEGDTVFSGLAIFTVFSVILGTEMFFLGDSRMNTVFKFYMVAWTLLAVAVPYMLYVSVGWFKKLFVFKQKDYLIVAGAAVAWLGLMLLANFLEVKKGVALFQVLFLFAVIAVPVLLFAFRDAVMKYLFAATLIFLLVPAFYYPLQSAINKMKTCSMNFKEPPRINGTAFLSRTNNFSPAEKYDKTDAGAIEWINKNLKTIEIIAEAPGDRMYQGFSRISIFTGMPTLIGWKYQVDQQSGRVRETNQAMMDTNTIYTLQDVQQLKDFLKAKGVGYVYYGTLERANYPGADARLAIIATPVYSNDGATLFKLND